jgi:hypothetical protein
MSLIIIPFIMVTGLAVAAVLKLESESRAEQYQRIGNRKDARFVE